jgi:hypothetical protein
LAWRWNLLLGSAAVHAPGHHVLICCHDAESAAAHLQPLLLHVLLVSYVAAAAAAAAAHAQGRNQSMSWQQ